MHYIDGGDQESARLLVDNGLCRDLVLKEDADLVPCSRWITANHAAPKIESPFRSVGWKENGDVRINWKWLSRLGPHAGIRHVH